VRPILTSDGYFAGWKERVGDEGSTGTVCHFPDSDADRACFLQTMDVGWLPAGLIVVSVIAGLSLGDLAFQRLADPETIQRDLEERVRNQHL
jgi:hypothetical protein